MYEYIAISAGNALVVDLVVIDIRHDSVGENLQANTTSLALACLLHAVLSCKVSVLANILSLYLVDSRSMWGCGLVLMHALVGGFLCSSRFDTRRG